MLKNATTSKICMNTCVLKSPLPELFSEALSSFLKELLPRHAPSLLLHVQTFSFMFQVYRTYRGDVSLITDIVRCAVQFETSSEMRKFVSMWIEKYGQVREIEEKVGWLTSIQKDASECVRIFGEYFRKAADSETVELVDAEENDSKDQHASSGVEEFKLFEICRIRNRLDPDLIDVPGGYRDLAFKWKMGFVRCGFEIYYHFKWCALYHMRFVWCCGTFVS
jgi:hypothetical protein